MDGIQQFDAPGILSIYQGAKDRRVNEMLMQRKIALEDRQLQREDALRNAYGKLRQPGQTQQGGGGPVSPVGGLSDAYAQPAPMGAPTPSMANMPHGSPLSPARDVMPTAPNAPMAAPEPPQQLHPDTPPPQTWLAANRDVVDSLMTIDPEEAFKLTDRLNGMDEKGIAKAQQTAQLFAKVAEHLSSFPVQARPAELQRITPDLIAEGIPQEMIAKADISDSGVQWLQVHGMDLDKIIARQKDDRDAAERARHNRAEEGNAAAGLDVRRGGLALAREREARVRKWGSQAVTIVGGTRSDTSDLDY